MSRCHEHLRGYCNYMGRQINSKEGRAVNKPNIFFFPCPVVGLTLCWGYLVMAKRGEVKVPFWSQTKVMLDQTDLCKCRLLWGMQGCAVVSWPDSLGVSSLLSAVSLCWAGWVARPVDRFGDKNRQPIPFSPHRPRRHTQHQLGLCLQSDSTCFNSACGVTEGDSVWEVLKRGMLSHWAGLIPLKCQSRKHSHCFNWSRLAEGLGKIWGKGYCGNSVAAKQEPRDSYQ